MSAPDLRALKSIRNQVLGTLDGLSEEQLRRPVLPSGWHCLGMVQHLTLDVERFWISAVMAADADAITCFASPPESWRVDSDTTSAEVIEAYRIEAERSDAILAGLDAAATPGWWPGDQFGDWRLNTTQEVVLHVLVETARHAGHLDATRELIDGHQWLVLT